MNPNENQPDNSTTPVTPTVPSAEPTTPAPVQTGPTSAASFRDASQKREAGELLTLDSGNVVRVKRPSINKLVKSGQLPTELANAAIKVQSAPQSASAADIKKFAEYNERLVELSLLEPKLAKTPNYDAGEISIDDLADDEQTEIVIFVNGGLDALSKFREERQRVLAGLDSEALRSATE